MAVNLDDVRVFAAVARAGGFREASRASGTSASSASEAVRRLETEVGVRLLHRTTRSVAPTEAGARLLDRLGPALAEIASALDVVKSSRDQPAGTLRLNVPTVAARVVLPRILPPFLAAYPDIRVEVTADDELVDILAAGCDAGIRYAETLEKDMIAVPIGPREQRFALAASAAYLERRGRPSHPRKLLEHACLRVRFPGGAPIAWQFERDGEVLKIDPPGPLVGNLGNASDLLVAAAIAGTGILYFFEDWLQPHLESGALKPILERWWLRFPGPFLYYPSRRHMSAALRAFVDFIRADGRK
ncbi:MAG: LysR family transcriptional regulator [Myxococcales bacterium 68-20]|nr:LysR family transcriptional regulator [Myxococcales bacterium]OJY16035.1 MAG: LysR family transcriptional regulator [Myxococcales bacterium 68-20]